MKILAPYAYFEPEQAASSYLWQNLHGAFAQNGMYCYVFTPVPTRGISKEIRKQYSRERKYESLFDGKLNIRRIALWREPKGTLMRFVRYFVQCEKQYHAAVFSKKNGYDIIFAVSTPPIIGATCALIKKRLHIPFVYNLQDIFPDSLMGANITQNKGLIWKLGRKLENFTYRHADKIIVISEDFKRNIMAKGVPEEKIEVIYNWVDEQAVVNVNREDNKLFDKYHLDRNKFYITYCGNIGLTQNLEMLVETSDELSANQDIHFVLVGNGAYWKTLVGKLKEKRSMSSIKADDGTEALTFGNITLLPFQPYDDISHVFSLGDASIIISKPGVGANSVPSKTWSIMSASRPVIANFDENEIKSILTDNNCGIFTKAGDKDAFKEAIITLYNDREKAAELGRNGRQFILQNLTKEIGTKKYVEVIKSVVEGK